MFDIQWVYWNRLGIGKDNDYMLMDDCERLLERRKETAVNLLSLLEYSFLVETSAEVDHEFLLKDVPVESIFVFETFPKCTGLTG